jgi:hypothetical protein
MGQATPPTAEHEDNSISEALARWALPASLFFAALAAAPLLGGDFLNTRGGGDSPFLLFRLHQLVAALRDGAIPARWMPDAAFGLGYPFFSYYAALPYYLAAAFRALGLSYAASLKMTQIAGFALAAGGAYAWARWVLGRAWSAAGVAAAYTFAPFHMVNVYVRGDSLSECWAMALYPCILWALEYAAERPTARRAALVGLCYGALVMTHNISALIFSPFAGLYALLLLERPASDRARTSRAAALIGGLALGLGLAAWFWLPALAEQGAVQLGEQTTGYFFYGQHFRMADLVQPSFLFDYDIGAGTPFSMGLVQAGLVGIGGLALAWQIVRKRQPTRYGFTLGGLLVSTLMVTPLSRPLWDHLPLLPMVQFPWRFLSIQALFGAMATGVLIDIAPTRWRMAGAVGVGMLLAVAGLGGLRPDFVPITDADVTPERLGWYEAFSGNIGTTIRAEYLPVWTIPRPYTSDALLGRSPRAKVLSGEGQARRALVGATWQEWHVEAGPDGARLAFPLLYWPGWRTSINGQPVWAGPVEGLGWIQVDVPPGKSVVRLWLGHTPVRLVAELISLAALIVAVGLWWFERARQEWEGRKRASLRLPTPGANWQRTALLLFGLTVLATLAVTLRAMPPPQPGPTLTADFDQEAYFHPSPEGVDWNNGARLLGYDYAEHIEAGEMLRGELRWEHLAPEMSVGLALIPSSVHPPSKATPLAEVRLPGAGQMRFALRVPADATPGLYFLRMRVEDASGAVAAAHTSGGRARGDLFLRPVLVRSQAESAGLIAEWEPLALLDARTEQVAPDRLDVTLTWQALNEAAGDYALALRLNNAAGNEWAAYDAQVGGGGLYPSGLWQPGEVVPERVSLILDDMAPPGDDYTLTITLYDARTLAPLGSTQVEGMALAHATPYTGKSPHRLGGGLALDGLSRPRQVARGDRMTIEARWVTLDAPDQTYRAHWWLLDASGLPAWEAETPLAPGSDPATWGAGVIVLGRLSLDVPFDLPPGDYTLRLGLVGEDGEPVGGRLRLGQITITEGERIFDLPALSRRLEVTFGDELKMWGYDLSQQGDTLTLRVAWGALSDPSADYTFFVHVFDPASERIVAQVDAMPHAYAYPTSRWVAGEVVSDTLRLDLGDVPPGHYQLALGWYDASGRLPTFGPEGRLPDDRVVLPDQITVR